MSLPATFVRDLAPIPRAEVLQLFSGKERPSFGGPWRLTGELRPADLYCYCTARFGPPNGLQNLFRSPSSDNLIHWEWVVRSDTLIVMLQGHTFRTEIWVSGPAQSEAVKSEFVEQLKADFPAHGAAMSGVRQSLEDWVEFVNPYQRLRRSVQVLLRDIDALGIDDPQGEVQDFGLCGDPEEFKRRWDEQAARYSRAIGLCLGVRIMLPIMAEGFVNLLLHTLMKPEIRQSERLRDNTFRQPSDIRIGSLSVNCLGFSRSVDYGAGPCARYQSLVNNRNDLLHANVNIEKLRFGEVYFNGTVPVFKQYALMWERAFGVAHRSVGMDKVKEELGVVDALVEYLLSCLEEKVRARMRVISEVSNLGICKDDGRLGVLFPEVLVDWRVGGSL